MRERKDYEVSLFIAACILLNFTGKMFAERLALPLWLDSMGTMLTAYMYGPFCGAVVGASVNIIGGFTNSVSYIYAFTSIAIGVITGICAKRKMLESLFGTLSAGFLVTTASVLISTPLNCILYAGYTGNIWGDGIIDMLLEWDIPIAVCSAVGEFYVDFPDKVLLLATLELIVKLHRTLKKRRSSQNNSNDENNQREQNTQNGLSNQNDQDIQNSQSNQNTQKAAWLFLAALLSVSLLFPCSTAYAASENGSEFDDYSQTVYDGTNGLPSGTANDIAQTKDGILWVGTYGGLYRYDGTNFEWMNSFESVKNVNCLYTDSEGRLWIGTNDSGLSIYINGSISNVIDEMDDLPSNSVRCIAQSPNGSYYVGTTSSLAIVTLSSGISITGILDEIHFAQSISVNEEGLAAIVTDAGDLYVVNGSEILSKTSCDKQGMSFTCCTFDESGRLYVGTTENRIEIFRVAAGVPEPVSSIETSDLAFFKSLNIREENGIIACADNGAGYIDKLDQFHQINTGSFNDSVDHMLFDYQGNLWFTSSRLGLLRLCHSPFTNIFDKIGLEPAVVNTVMKWQGKMYIGTDDGLIMTDEDMKTQLENSLTRALEGTRIRCLMVDSADQLWICTSGRGVMQVAANGRQIIYDSSNGTLGDRFRTSLEMADGTIALAGDLGITFVRDGQVTGVIGSEDGLENPKVLCLLEDQDGYLLAGTDGNGIAAIRNGKVAFYMQREQGLSSEVILRMVHDSKDGGIYIVTGNSLCYMDKDKNIRVLENFPYYNNLDLVEGKGEALFVLSSAGIYVVDRSTLLAGEPLNYVLLDAKNGMLASFTPDSWNYLDSAGSLYMSCSTGVMSFSLDSYNRNFRSYRMQLRSVLVDGVSYEAELGETLYIPRGADRIVLMPEVINYSTEEPRVSVYLEGFDSSPHVMPLSELSSLTYTNLPTGSYKFRMSVLNMKEQRLAEITYDIVKEKEIYDYWWFKLYVALVAALTIVYLTWLLFRTQAQRTLNLQKKELELAKRQMEMGNEAIMTIARIVDAKDANTSQHSIRVSEYSSLIARRLGFDENACEDLRRTALLHDIGKIGIPDSILNKPERLTDDEYAIMKSHVVMGAEILKNFTSIDNIVEGALFHHERYDGSGYVYGLMGEDIPLNARIIGIADAFDAMTANRVYRERLDFSYVLEELKRGRGTQFDPQLVDVLLELIDDGTIQVEKLYETEEQNEMNPYEADPYEANPYEADPYETDPYEVDLNETNL